MSGIKVFLLETENKIPSREFKKSPQNHQSLIQVPLKAVSSALEPEAFGGVWDTHAEVVNILLFPLNILFLYFGTVLILDWFWDGLQTCSALWISAEIFGENASVNFEFGL